MRMKNIKLLQSNNVCNDFLLLLLFLFCETENKELTGLLLLFSHSVTSDSLQPHGLQHTRLPCPHARLPCPSPSPRACSNSCPLSQWCHPTISSFVVPFSSCFRSFLASEELNEHTSYGERGNFHRSSSSPTSFLLMLIKIYHWPIS